MRPHRRQPTRLHHPWDSPGKNTGVGCHFLLQCRKVKSESDVAQSCLTPRDPMDCSPPGSSVHGIFQARVLEWGAIAFSKTRLMPHKFLFVLECNLEIWTFKSSPVFLAFSKVWEPVEWRLLIFLRSWRARLKVLCSTPSDSTGSTLTFSGELLNNTVWDPCLEVQI